MVHGSFALLTLALPRETGEGRDSSHRSGYCRGRQRPTLRRYCLLELTAVDEIECTVVRRKMLIYFGGSPGINSLYSPRPRSLAN